MKKTRLLIEYEFDFDLVGLITTTRGYQLAWQLNQLLGTHLVRQTDLAVGFKNSEEKLFTNFAHQSSLNRLKLFKNRPNDGDSGKYFLIPEFPHFDFIILAAMHEQFDTNQLMELVKTLPQVQLVTAIPLEGLKSKSNFIF